MSKLSFSQERMDFCGIAQFYHLIEQISMGSALQKARTYQIKRLARLAAPRRALLIGEGDGSFLIAFRRQFPATHITVVERSKKMIERAQRRIAKSDIDLANILFIHADLLQANIETSGYDLVTTMFFLDNFDEVAVETCINRIIPALKPDAYWLVSDFTLPEGGWRRVRAHIWLWVLYRFFRMVAKIPAQQLPNIEHHYCHKQFKVLNLQRHNGDMLFSAMYRLSS